MSPLYVVVVNDVVEIGILCYWPLVKSHLVAEARNHLQKHLTRNLTLEGVGHSWHSEVHYNGHGGRLGDGEVRAWYHMSLP